MAKGPIFLERQTYRQRRMMDAVRLLPLLGLALWMVPLLWPVQDLTSAQAEDARMPMSVALRYLFGVWGFLVIMGVLLWLRTGQKTKPRPTGPSRLQDAPD